MVLMNMETIMVIADVLIYAAYFRWIHRIGWFKEGDNWLTPHGCTLILGIPFVAVFVTNAIIYFIVYLFRNVFL